MLVFAVKVTEVPEHIVVPGLAVTFIVGVTLGTMVIVMLPVTVAGVAQGALLVKVQLTISFVFKTDVEYVEPVPTGLPFTYHWYAGEGPPLAIFAVNVTLAPAQAVLPGLAVMLIVGNTVGVTVMVMGVLVTTGVSTQGALLVS